MIGSLQYCTNLQSYRMVDSGCIMGQDLHVTHMVSKIRLGYHIAIRTFPQMEAFLTAKRNPEYKKSGYLITSNLPMLLTAFCEASKTCYTSCVYLGCVHSCHNIFVQLLIAKLLQHCPCLLLLAL